MLKIFAWICTLVKNKLWVSKKEGITTGSHDQLHFCFPSRFEKHQNQNSGSLTFDFISRFKFFLGSSIIHEAVKKRCRCRKVLCFVVCGPNPTPVWEWFDKRIELSRRLSTPYRFSLTGNTKMHMLNQKQVVWPQKKDYKWVMSF